MTERVNGNAPKWFWPLYLALLPVLMGMVIVMVGFYLNKLTCKIDDVEIEMGILKANQKNMSRVIYLNPDTSPDNRDELRLIFHNIRSVKQ